MNREQLEKAKSILKELRESETSSALLKRAAVVAVVLGFIRSSSGLADNDVSKLVKALGPATDKPLTGTPWSDWNDWKDWKDWKDWSDWNDWNNWADWKDWRDWTDWNDWKDWRDWMNLYPAPTPTPTHTPMPVPAPTPKPHT